MLYNKSDHESVSCSKLNPCPICGNTSRKKCRIYVNLEPNGSRRVICGTVKSEIPTRDGYWRHYINDGGKQVAPPSNLIASPEARDKIYSFILSNLPLSPWHHEILTQRGYSDSDIERHEFRSWSQILLTPIAQLLTKNFTQYELWGIPGLYTARDNLRIVSWSGIAIPLRDKNGLVTALKIDVNLEQRFNQDGTKKTGKVKTKYKLLSSSGYSGGASPGAALSVEYPQGINRGGKIWVTEGEHKANIAASILNETVISIGGAGQAGSSGLIPTLKSMGCQNVILAFDADKREKPSVKNAEKQAVLALLEAEINVDIAEWETSSGNGLDDMLINRRRRLDEITESRRIAAEGMEIDIPAPVEIRHRHCQAIDYYKRGDLVKIRPEDVPSPSLPNYEIVRARQFHLNLARKLLSTPLTDGSVHLLSGSPGSGKTYSFIEILSEMLDTNTWPQSKQDEDSPFKPEKIAYMTDSKQMGEESRIIFIEGAKPIYGRSRDQNDKGYCLDYENCNRCGKNRHNVKYDRCKPTADGYKCSALKREQKRQKDPDWLCPYIRMMEEAKHSLIPYTTKHKMMAGGKILESSSKIIADECILPFVTEKCHITKDTISRWISAMNRIEGVSDFVSDDTGKVVSIHSMDAYPEGHPWKIFFSILTGALDTAENIDWKQMEDRELRLLPFLKQSAENIGYDSTKFSELVRVLANQPTKRQTKAYNFEEPFVENGRTVYPLRILEDLLELLQDEIDCPGGADTGLWLTKQDGIPVIAVNLLKWKIIEDLRKKTLIILDATPSPLLWKIFPNLQEHECRINDHIHVTQFSDKAYRRGTLASNEKLLRQVEADVIQRADELGAKRPVVISFKCFNPNIEDNAVTFNFPSHFRVGHFGKDDKGINHFKDADAIFIVGTQTPNLSHLKMLTHSIRRSKIPVLDGETLEIIPYCYRDPGDGTEPTEGNGVGKVLKARIDPLYNAVIRHAQMSIIIQALYRGRPGNKTADNPLNVILYTDIPIYHRQNDGKLNEGVEINMLTKLGVSKAEEERRAKIKAKYERKREMLHHNAMLIMMGENPPTTVTALTDALCEMFKSKAIEKGLNAIRCPHLERYGINAEWISRVVHICTIKNKINIDTNEHFSGSNSELERDLKKSDIFPPPIYIYIKEVVGKTNTFSNPFPTEAIQEQTLNQLKNEVPKTLEEEKLFRDELEGLENDKVVHNCTSSPSPFPTSELTSAHVNDTKQLKEKSMAKTYPKILYDTKGEPGRLWYNFKIKGNAGRYFLMVFDERTHRIEFFNCEDIEPEVKEIRHYFESQGYYRKKSTNERYLTKPCEDTEHFLVTCIALNRGYSWLDDRPRKWVTFSMKGAEDARKIFDRGRRRRQAA